MVSDGTNMIKPGAQTACYKPGEAVVIRWDANEERNEASNESAQRLLKSKWNPRGKHSEGSWRLDVCRNQWRLKVWTQFQLSFG